METYDRDSLRTLRREAQQTPRINRRGNRWFTFLIILLFILAGGFFIFTQAGLDPDEAKNTILEWGEDIAAVFKKQENDITETVDAVLAQQNEQV